MIMKRMPQFGVGVFRRSYHGYKGAITGHDILDIGIKV